MRKSVLGLIVVVGLLGASACKESTRPTDTGAAPAAAPEPVAAPDAAPAAKAAPAAAGARVLSADQRQAMLEKLDIRGGTPRSVWFATVPNNPEAANFQTQVQEVFEEAGWKVAGNERVTFSLKAGIFFFMADEEPADYMQNVIGAFEDAGIEITAGRGYRDFYREKKKEDPSWNGFDLKDGQDFILVIGRAPAA